MATLTEILREDNPRAKQTTLDILGDALAAYYQAQAEVVRQGAIVIHPRTGAPIDNPYLRLAERAARQILAIDGIKSDRAAAAAQAAARGA